MPATVWDGVTLLTWLAAVLLLSAVAGRALRRSRRAAA